MGLLDELNKPFDGCGNETPGDKKRAKRLGYIRQQGVISLSFSRVQTLYSCPRKFLLRELKQRQPEAPSVHLAYGSAFGAGLAELFRTQDVARACVVALSHWDYDGWESKFVRNKSFWECCHTLALFQKNLMPRFNEDWELAYFNGKPAVELIFYIRVSETYDYQGHIDIILRHKETGQLAVVECKTASSPQTTAKWENSEQALGYYFVMRSLQEQQGVEVAPETIYITSEVGKWADPEVDWGFKIFRFEQSEYSEHEFSGGLYAAMHMLDFFIEHDFFPKRGSACSAYGRTCEYFGTCDFAMMDSSDAINASDAVYESLSIEDADFYLDLRSTSNADTRTESCD